MGIDYKKWLEILSLYLVGAFAKITGEVWEVEAERCGHDFEFNCRFGEFVRETQSYDFTDPKLYERLLIDAQRIAYICGRETGKVKVPVQEFYMVKKMLSELEEKQ